MLKTHAMLVSLWNTNYDLNEKLKSRINEHWMHGWASVFTICLPYIVICVYTLHLFIILSACIRLYKFGWPRLSNSQTLKRLSLFQSLTKMQWFWNNIKVNKWWQFTEFGWTFLFKFHLASKSHAMIQIFNKNVLEPANLHVSITITKSTC